MMSEKLSELEKYVCDLCGATQCLTPTRKGLSKEGKNNEGDMIIIDYDIYHCCRDNNLSSYCAYCLEVTTPEKEKVEEKPAVIKVISKVVDKAKGLPGKAVSELQSEADALLAKIRKLKEDKNKLEEQP